MDSAQSQRREVELRQQNILKIQETVNDYLKASASAPHSSPSLLLKQQQAAEQACLQLRNQIAQQRECSQSLARQLLLLREKARSLRRDIEEMKLQFQPVRTANLAGLQAQLARCAEANEQFLTAQASGFAAQLEQLRARNARGEAAVSRLMELLARAKSKGRETQTAILSLRMQGKQATTPQHSCWDNSPATSQFEESIIAVATELQCERCGGKFQPSEFHSHICRREKDRLKLEIRQLIAGLKGSESTPPRRY